MRVGFIGFDGSWKKSSKIGSQGSEVSSFSEMSSVYIGDILTTIDGSLKNKSLSSIDDASP